MALGKVTGIIESVIAKIKRKLIFTHLKWYCSYCHVKTQMLIKIDLYILLVITARRAVLLPSKGAVI